MAVNFGAAGDWRDDDGTVHEHADAIRAWMYESSSGSRQERELTARYALEAPGTLLSRWHEEQESFFADTLRCWMGSGPGSRRCSLSSMRRASIETTSYAAAASIARE